MPITHLLEDAPGGGGALVFEWVAMIALFAGGLANMAAASRLMLSLSRDRMLPGYRRLAPVSPTTHTPTGSLATVTAISAALVAIGTYIATEAMTLIVGMASVGYRSVYALTSAVVIWAGGFFVVAACHARGARVLGVGRRRAERLRLARAFGAEATVTDPADLAGLTGGEGPDVVVEAAGQPQAWPRRWPSFAELLTHAYPLERVAQPLAQAAGLTDPDDRLLKAVIRP